MGFYEGVMGLHDCEKNWFMGGLYCYVFLFQIEVLKDVIWKRDLQVGWILLGPFKELRWALKGFELDRNPV